MYHLYCAFLVLFGILVAQIDARIRLMNGINEFQGRLEVYENGRWGTVCNNGWDQHKENVHVACQQLGFASSGRYTSRYRRRDKTFLIDNLICNGEERGLGACQFDVLRKRNCAGRDDYEINLFCDRPPPTVLPSTDDIRLMNGKDAFEGRVEIFRGNNWLSVCQNGWGTTEARVVCKQLGFNGGIPKFNAFYGRGFGTPWRVKLSCDSNEDKLIECDVLSAICIPSNTVGVVCEAPVPFGSPCEPDEQCEGNSECVVYPVRQLCQCVDTSTMFWDNARSTCKMKSGYKESCQSGIPDNCANTLVCNSDGNASKCVCLQDMFWDDRQKLCEQKAGHNDQCQSGIPDNCANTLVCNSDGTESRCLCLHDMFWDDRQTKCEQKAGYNEPCQSGIPDNCASTLICNSDGNASKCVCLKGMFWDDRQRKCEQKAGYNEPCQSSITDNCASTLVCNSDGTESRCLCLQGMFWDDRQTKCEKRSLYNETCYADTTDSCGGNLVCSNQYNNSVCLCNDEGHMFWDIATSACQPKKPYNNRCGSSRECQSNLVCRNDNDLNRCLCAEQGLSIWHVGTNSCLTVTQLQAVYIQLELDYNEAEAYCANEVNGSLATWNDFQMVFENCTDNIADVWLQTTSEMPNITSMSCQLASIGIQYHNISCSERLNFVCIHERDTINNVLCRGFPSVTMSPEQHTSSHTVAILTVVMVSIILFVTGAAVTVFIYKSKRNKYKRTWNSNSQSASDGTQAFLNNTYDTSGPFLDNANMEVRAANEPDYANIAATAETLKPRQVKSNRDNENPYTEVPCKSTGYIDMDGRLLVRSTNVTGDSGYTQCNPCMSTTASRDHYIRCDSSTSTAAAPDDYFLSSGSETTPGVYNTFSDMKNISAEHITENPYDHIQLTSEDDYGVLNGPKGLVTDKTDDDISGQINSLEFPL